MRVEVVRAWPDRHAGVRLELAESCDAAGAAQASGLLTADIAGYAVFGERITPQHVLRDGDRLELLRALELDPKEARRLRARRSAG